MTVISHIIHYTDLDIITYVMLSAFKCHVLSYEKTEHG